MLGEKGFLYLIGLEKSSTKNHICLGYIVISHNFNNDVIFHMMYILILRDTLSHDNSHSVSSYISRRNYLVLS